MRIELRDDDARVFLELLRATLPWGARLRGYASVEDGLLSVTATVAVDPAAVARVADAVAEATRVARERVSGEALDQTTGLSGYSLPLVPKMTPLDPEVCRG